MVVITQKLKELFVKNGISENKILVAPDAVDLEKFDIKETQEECRKRLNLPLDKKIVLYTGHLYQWKGTSTLIEAARHLPKEVEIYFVGGTKRDLANVKSQMSSVKFIGQRPHSEISYWLKAADVLVLPNSGKEEISKSWTSPLKLFEYMASKRPIVASDLPSLREILNENNAVLVRPDDQESLAQGIKRVLEDKDLAEKISNRAFQNVQNHTLEKRAENILKFISQNL